MSELKNRNTQYPNRRKLNVQNIEYNENGEIVELLADVIRSEGEIYEEGTKLNAEGLGKNIKDITNECIEDFIITKYERIKAMVESICGNKFSYFYNLEHIKSDLESIQLINIVTEDFTLPSEGMNGSSIVWSSSNPELINIEGNLAKVNRQVVDWAVTLTANGTYKTVTHTKEYVIFIKARESTDLEKVEFDKNHIIVPNVVEHSFELPLEGECGSSIEWNSNSSYITIKDSIADVTRPCLDQACTLTAIITKGNAKATRSFIIHIKGTIGYASDSLECLWAQRRGILKSKTYTITSYSTALDIEIDVDSTFISALVDENLKNQVKFTILETSEANLSNGNGILSIPYTIHIRRIGASHDSPSSDSIVGIIKYYRESTTPND